MDGTVLLLFFISLIGAIVLFITVFTRISSLEKKVKLWHLRMLELEGRLGKTAAPPSSPGPHTRTVAEPAPSQEPPQPRQAASPSPIQRETFGHIDLPFPPAVAQHAAGSTDTLFGKDAERTSKSREEWENFLGGKILNRIGALALFLGVGFFLKYAFDNNWLSPLVRTLIGAGAGIGLLASAARFHRRNLPIFAQGLVGAGIAILYLTVYAAFTMYQLVSQPVAFLLMIGVTIIAFTQAFRHDSLAVSLLGWLGGFLTPFLLSTGQANEAGLFTYLAVLDAGLLAVCLRKPAWFVLQPLTLLGTMAIYALWFSEYYTPENFSLTVGILLALWGLFFASDLIVIMRGEQGNAALRRIMTGAAAVLFHLALWLIVNPDHHAWMGLVTLGLAVVYLGAGWGVRRTTAAPADAWAFLVLLAGYLVAVGAVIQFDHEWIIAAWAVEALLLGVVIRQSGPAYIEAGTGLLLLLAAIVLAFMTLVQPSLPPDRYHLLFNERTAGFALLGLALFITARLFRGHAKPWHTEAGNAMEVTWTVAAFVWIAVETFDAVHFGLQGSPRAESVGFLAGLSVAFLWTVYGGVLILAGSRAGWSTVASCGIVAVMAGLVFAGIRGSTFVPLADFTLLFNVRAATLILCAGIGLVLRSHLQVFTADANGRVALDTVAISALVLVLLLGTAEARDFFEGKIVMERSADRSNAIHELRNMEQLIISGVWLVYSIAGVMVGLTRRLRGVRYLAMGVFFCAIAKIFVYDLSFLETLYRIFSFIGLGVILLAASYLYQRNKGIILGDTGAKADAGTPAG